MDKRTVLDNLYANYGRKHGITKADLLSAIEDGINNHGLFLDAVYSCLRMSLASAFNEHETFSLEDVQAVTGESREELLERIEQCRQELIAEGKNPDEYFQPIQPQSGAVYFFPNGLH